MENTIYYVPYGALYPGDIIEFQSNEMKDVVEDAERLNFRTGNRYFSLGKNRWFRNRTDALQVIYVEVLDEIDSLKEVLAQILSEIEKEG